MCFSSSFKYLFFRHTLDRLQAVGGREIGVKIWHRPNTLITEEKKLSLHVIVER